MLPKKIAKTGEVNQMEGKIEKRALSPEDRNKYVKAAIIAALGSAGIGTLIKNIKSDKDRKKALDVNVAKNVITVPIKKSKFLEGLPTPDEYSESTKAEAASSRSPKKMSLGSLDPSSIAAKKKEILRGRKFNFFGGGSLKSAEEEKKEKAPSEEGKKRDDVVSEEKIDGRVVLRGQDGKFVSPTDPVAVQAVEKDAQAQKDQRMGIWDIITNPGKAVDRAWGAAKDRPVVATAGFVGSIILAAKIADMVNERRKKKAERMVDGARDRYVEVLQGNTEKAAFVPPVANAAVGSSLKSASPDIPQLTGTVLGTAFLVPMALTALVTNRIIENRRRDKKKEKEKSDTYPDDPVILYKTSESKEIAISPKTAVAAIMFKAAMIRATERGWGSNFIIKSAAGFDFGAVLDKAKKKVSNLGGQVADKFREYNISDEDASDYVLGLMEDPNNSNLVLDMVKARDNNDSEGVKNALTTMMTNNYQSKSPDERTKRVAVSYVMNPARQQKLMDSVLTSNRMQDLMVNRFTDDKYKDSFGAYKDELFAKSMGLKPGGLLHKIMSWFMNVTGLGNHMVKSQLYDKFRGFREEAAQRAQAAKGKLNTQPNVAGGATGNVKGKTMTPAPSGTPTAPIPPAAPTAPIPSVAPAVSPPVGGSTTNDFQVVSAPSK